MKTSARVKEIRECPEGLKVLYEAKEKEQELVCENVLLSIGRELETESAKALGLERAGGNRIVVNEYI